MSVEFIETNQNGVNITVSSTISSATWRSSETISESRTCSVARVGEEKFVVTDSSYCYDNGCWVNAGTCIVNQLTGVTVYSGGYLPMDSLIDELSTRAEMFELRETDHGYEIWLPIADGQGAYGFSGITIGELVEADGMMTVAELAAVIVQATNACSYWPK